MAWIKMSAGGSQTVFPANKEEKVKRVHMGLR
jgi:hypothetical protein